MIHHTQISTQNELDLNIKPETLKFLEKNIKNLLLNIAILFTISKTWKQSKCPTVDNGKRRCEIHMYTHRGLLFSHKKGNPAICDDMDRPWGHYAKWNKLERERQILYNLTYMWNLKILDSTETERMVVVRGWVEEMGRCWSRCTLFFLVQNVFIWLSLLCIRNSTVQRRSVYRLSDISAWAGGAFETPTR